MITIEQYFSNPVARVEAHEAFIRHMWKRGMDTTRRMYNGETLGYLDPVTQAHWDTWAEACVWMANNNK